MELSKEKDREQSSQRENKTKDDDKKTNHAVTTDNTVCV